MERTSFNDLGLIEPILKALETEGYTHPTPIQEQAIPHLIQGRDLLGCAQTGTGKTAAFAIPILQELHSKAPQAKRAIRTLILTPTRELAIQIGESFAAYGRNLQLKHTVIFGGVGQKPQTDALHRGVDIVVATPGRLLDLMSQGFIHLEGLEIFVLDEADRMLDMGFIHDVKKVIAKLPKKRQTLFFSATMPPEIAKLANSILTNPLKVEVAPQSTTAETIDQHMYFVDRTDKNKLLLHLMEGDTIREALIFTRTKHGANKVAKILVQAGIGAEAIHGNKSQTARQNALKNFKDGKIRALVATDIAARGIDIDGLTHVINFDIPNIPETYVHRIGRTGRAGADGRALSFCDHEEKAFLRDIIRLIKRDIPVVAEHEFVMVGGPKKAIPEVREPRQPRGPGRGQGQRGGGQRNAPRAAGEGNRPSGERRSNGNRGGQRSRSNEPREQRTPAPAQGQRQPRPEREARPQGQNSRGPRPDQRERRPQQANARNNDRRPNENKERNDRPTEQQKSSAAKPDYAAMTKELFGDAELRTKDQQREKKEKKEKKGSILGRLFGA
ncbi:MAG: DEAD/DEAH box helicase [Flavobacteriales bacterium]|jgi:ATP-dependent RNA helicase RhlE|nr:DEAD/DEAH box helicase [Flavobacteriales bacterium]MBK7618641.1 DEAD/DEAH box helicase [Flavobacteriales bacterium]MBK8708807.1 DEAD/DEAH box helicase [Flavobacteriales bacterium]